MSQIFVSTPEILWQGGGNENGKTDPVLAIDILGTSILATAGIDANVPPRGTARLWKFGASDADLVFLVDLCDHDTVVNVVRFSPCGRMLAAASDRVIIIYSVSSPEVWETLSDAKQVERVYLRPSLQEIYDLAWSPNSDYVIAGSIDTKAEILRLSKRDILSLRGHTSYVQGVAWDPRSQYVVSQSADRSVKVYQLQQNRNGVIQKTPAKATIKSYSPPQAPEGSRGVSLYADSVPCFFRRPTFTPDGCLLLTPTGVFKSAEDPVDATFCVHVYIRDGWTAPAVSLVGLETPAVAIRCNPRLFKLIEDHQPLFEGPYRMLFAVVTTTTIYIYDTQHCHPLVRIAGCHCSTLNDVAWTSDGTSLAVCSSDGYISFVRFKDGALGEMLNDEDVSVTVKKCYPYTYNFIEAKPVDDEGDAPEAPATMTEQVQEAAVAMEVTGDKITEPPASELPAQDSSAKLVASTTTKVTCDDKKRKRITPTMIGKVGDAAPVNKLNSPSPTIIDIEEKSFVGKGSPIVISVDATKKVKKRIAPQLISALPQVTPMSLNNSNSAAPSPSDQEATSEKPIYVLVKDKDVVRNKYFYRNRVVAK